MRVRGFYRRFFSRVVGRSEKVGGLSFVFIGHDFHAQAREGDAHGAGLPGLRD